MLFHLVDKLCLTLLNYFRSICPLYEKGVLTLEKEYHLPLTAEQYNHLYCLAFARLDDIARQAEQAMRELEELQLAMGDRTEDKGLS